MKAFKLNKVHSVVIAILIAGGCYSQPFVDIVNFHSQFFTSNYTDSTKAKNKTNDYVLNLFLPKEFKNGNVFIARLFAEQLHSERFNDTSSTYSNVYSLMMPLGFQWLSKNKKWKLLLLAMPKISSDFKNRHYNDLQLGGTTLVTYVKNENFKLKFGLYYNREFFGNFFIPLLGIDWKVNEHLSFYGLLPNNFRMEFKLNKHFYTGLGFNSFQRSYRLGSEKTNDDLVWVRESTVKAFLDIYITKSLILFGDVGYTLNYRLVQYQHENVKAERDINPNPIYTPFQKNVIFRTGLAYRIRKD